MRRFARLLPLLAILALVAAAAFVLLRAGPLTEHVRKVVQAELAKQLGRPVSIGSASLTPTGSVVLNDIVIKNSDSTVLLNAPEMQARIGGLRSILRGSTKGIQVRSIRLKQPELNLVRHSDGRWSISDLLERTAEAPNQFRGTLSAEGATISFLDETRDGQVTSVTNADVTFTQRTQEQVTFSVRAGANPGVFDSFSLQGESDRGAKQTELDAQASGLNIPFAVKRIPGLTALTVAAGRADVKGKLAFGGELKSPSLEYDATADVKGAEVSFPWLRRPVKAVEGRLRIADGTIRLENMKGTVENAPVEVHGAITEFSRPVFDLDLAINGIRYPQVRALFPRMTLPGMLLPSALRVEAKVEGPADNIKVTGEASVKVIRFRAIPWHDVVGQFEYQDNHLRINTRGHGSARRFEAKIEVDLRKGAQAQGTLSLADMPLSMLAEMAGIKGEFRGVVHANVRGAIQEGGRLQGDFVVEGAAIQGVNFGRLAGEFTSAGQQITLRQVRISGPAADGVFDADISLPGSYKLNARFATLDLTRLAPLVKVQGLQGRCCAEIEASGQVKAGQATAQLRLGPGEIQGRPFDSLAADLTMTRDRVAVRNLVVTAGQARVVGGLVVDGWRLPRERARLSGRIEVSGIQLEEQKLAGYEWLALTGSVSGALDIRGTLIKPQITGDFAGESVTVANRPASVARVRLRFVGGALVVEMIDLQSADGTILISGGYTPERGLAIQAAATRLDLSAIVPKTVPWVGFSLQGKLNVTEARITGPLDRPEVTLTAAAAPITVNGEQFDELSVSFQMKSGLLHVSKAVLRHGESMFSVAGDISPAGHAVDITAELMRIDIGAMMRIGDSALWRLYRSNPTNPFFTSPFVKRYISIPRPLMGLLTASVHGSGPVTQPRVQATLDLADFGFDTRTIQRVAGEVDLTLGLGAGRKASFRQGTVNLKASQDVTEITFAGNVTPDGQAHLSLDAGNFDLSVLNAWVHPPVELAGQAKIDFDITGPISSPLIRGGAFVDNPQLGPFPLESASAYPVSLEKGVLTVEELRVRNGPMEAIGTATVPVPFTRLSTVPAAELKVTDASFAPVSGMQPAQFNADLHLVGDLIDRSLHLYIEDGGGPGGGAPGIQGTLGSGKFSISGRISAALREDGWRPTYDLRGEFQQAQVSIPGLFDVKVTGPVELRNGPEGRPLLTNRQEGDPPTYQPLVVSDGAVSFERPQVAKSRLGGIFAPKVDVRVVVGDNVWFRRGSESRPTRIRIDPVHTATDGTLTGYMDIDGMMTAAETTLDGHFESHEGQLAFPNGVLTLQTGTARINRSPGKKPVVAVEAEAEGRVGEYLVSLNPSGQIYPSATASGAPAPFALNLTSSPPLDEAYVLALLQGPIVAPSLGARPDITSLLNEPTRVGAGTGEITGIRYPVFGALGMHEVSLDVGLTGQVGLRLGQRFLRRLIVSYVSPLSGPVQSRTLRFSYEVTPRYSIGWSVNELDQGRFDINAFVPF